MRKDSSSVQQQEHLYDTTEAYLTYKVGNRDVTTSSQQATKRKVKATSVKRYVDDMLSRHDHLSSLLVVKHQKTKRSTQSPEDS